MREITVSDGRRVRKLTSQGWTVFRRWTVNTPMGRITFVTLIK